MLIGATYEGLGEVGADGAELTAETGNALAPHYDTCQQHHCRPGGARYSLGLRLKAMADEPI